MESIQKRIQKLPPELQREVGDFIKFLIERRRKKSPSKPKFRWAGALNDLRDQYASVELQHKLLEWRDGER